MKKIEFYKVKDEYGYFSNFSPYPIVLDNKTWPTVEHYFQANKFLDLEYREAIRSTKSPMAAAKMGRDRKKPIRKDWEKIKLVVMKKAVLAKFNQHPTLKKILLETQNALIIEHTENDFFWGDGGNGTGKNMLGKTIMEVRKKLST